MLACHSLVLTLSLQPIFIHSIFMFFFLSKFIVASNAPNNIHREIGMLIARTGSTEAILRGGYLVFNCQNAVFIMLSS